MLATIAVNLALGIASVILQRLCFRQNAPAIMVALGIRSLAVAAVPLQSTRRQLGPRPVAIAHHIPFHPRRAQQ
eukprot:765654-Hanusia_phi.AAC.3